MQIWWMQVVGLSELIWLRSDTIAGPVEGYTGESIFANEWDVLLSISFQSIHRLRLVLNNVMPIRHAWQESRFSRHLGRKSRIQPLIMRHTFWDRRFDSWQGNNLWHISSWLHFFKYLQGNSIWGVCNLFSCIWCWERIFSKLGSLQVNIWRAHILTTHSCSLNICKEFVSVRLLSWYQERLIVFTYFGLDLPTDTLVHSLLTHLPLGKNDRHWGNYIFRSIFVNENSCILVFTENWKQGFNYQLTSICLDNSLALNRRQVIIWTTADPFD